MVLWPWGRSESTDSDHELEKFDEAPDQVCEFQDGTLYIYESFVYIDRAEPSDFDHKTISREDIIDVTYKTGIIIGYLQIEQAGFENDSGGFLTAPIDENTLHFGGGDKACAESARDQLLFEE